MQWSNDALHVVEVQVAYLAKLRAGTGLCRSLFPKVRKDDRGVVCVFEDLNAR